MEAHDDQYHTIHKTWQSHSENVKTDDHGEYIDLDEGMLSSAGLNFRDFDSPGNFRTFSDPANDTQTNYTVHSMGSGRFRVHRSH